MSETNTSNNFHVRGKTSSSVATALKQTGLSEPLGPSGAVSGQPVVPEDLPLPPANLSQAGEGTTSDQTSDHPQSFQQKRDHFLTLFDNRYWNHPDDILDGMDVVLQERRALVIVICYTGASMLPATYVDGYNMVYMLQEQFGYHPKAIRVMADRVDEHNLKDNRWPDKEKILRGIQWLNQGSARGSRRFLFFAGHGFTIELKDGEDVYTHEAIVPSDMTIYSPRTAPNNSALAFEQPYPGSILYDDELNKCLIDGLADGTKLTVVFDSCHSGGLTVLVPDIVDMSSIRERHEFIGHVIQSPMLNPALFGNLLGLPVELVEVNQANSDTNGSVDRSTLGTDSEMIWQGTRKPNMNFQAFPKECEVVSWSACERSQLATEDLDGGYFTSAFVLGMKQAPGGYKNVTYRALNRSIQSHFQAYNQQLADKYGVNRVDRVLGSSSTERASKNEAVEHRDRRIYQYPKLYVSANIADTIANKIVII